MIIKNAQVFSADHRFHEADLTIRNGRITACSRPLDGEIILDASGLLAIPGLVDIHFHGATGHDFCDADPVGLQAIAEYEARHGILAICPATTTLPEELLGITMETAAAHRNESGADLVGINMEGPFINQDRLGAQNPRYVAKGCAETLINLNDRSGDLIRLVDLAPEVPENMRLIAKLKDRFRFSLAHTAASYDTAKAAFAAGASQLTHAYNAMPGIGHRDPGPIIAAWECGADVELIADGIHVHPSIVRFTFSAFGADRVILISDSMMATGLPNGEYRLGGQAVTVCGNRAVLSDHPETIAGSVINLFDCMAHAVLKMGISMEDAVRAASYNPARAIGIEKDYGSLSVGAYGNVLLVDKELKLKTVIRKGKLLAGEGSET